MGQARPSTEVPAAAAALPESEKDRRLGELERDIAGLRAYLRAAIEEHGAIEEEQVGARRSAVGERGVSEHERELETSKEELQSTNEELTTAIDELRHRNQELAAVNAAR